MSLRLTDVGGWTTNAGTSFAAPVITGQLALFEACTQRALSSASARSILRTAAWTHQELEFNTSHASSRHEESDGDGEVTVYPTPSKDMESVAGAGIVDSHKLKRFCDDPGGNSSGKTGQGGGTFDMDASEDAPEPIYTDEPDPIEFEHSDWDQWSQPLNRSKFGVGELAYQRFFALTNSAGEPQLADGTRIRVTFSTYTCPAHYDPNTTEEDTSDPTEPGPGDRFYSDGDGDGENTPEEQRPVDVDIALCAFESSDYQNIGADGCRYFSDSIHDTNEGFDVILNENMENPALIAIHRKEAEACRGGRTFPYYWSVWYWPA